MAGAGPESRVAKCQFGIPDSHHITSPSLTYLSIPVCSKGYLPLTFSLPNNSPSNGKRSRQAELPGTALWTQCRAMLQLPPPFLEGKRSHLNLLPSLGTCQEWAGFRFISPSEFTHAMTGFGTAKRRAAGEPQAARLRPWQSTSSANPWGVFMPTTAWPGLGLQLWLP